MSKKRGLSLDEKRAEVLGIFHDSADVFCLKDIEKIAPKRGVVLQSVKEVLQSLVDDDSVHCEKIGIGNYYWSFPSEASSKLSAEVARLEKAVAAKEAEAAAAKKAVDDAEAASAAGGDGRGGGQTSEERKAALKLMEDKEARASELRSTLAEYANSDPSKLEAINEAAEVAKDSANRWLDNCYALKDWMSNKFEGRGDDVSAFFVQSGLTENVDYL